MYSGIWGGKWCNSTYDPPPIANATQKPQCPDFNSTAVPAIVPVQLPPILELRDGNIFVAGIHSSEPVSLVLKVRGPDSRVILLDIFHQDSQSTDTVPCRSS